MARDINKLKKRIEAMNRSGGGTTASRFASKAQGESEVDKFFRTGRIDTNNTDRGKRQGENAFSSFARLDGSNANNRFTERSKREHPTAPSPASSRSTDESYNDYMRRMRNTVAAKNAPARTGAVFGNDIDTGNARPPRSPIDSMPDMDVRYLDGIRQMLKQREGLEVPKRDPLARGSVDPTELARSRVNYLENEYNLNKSFLTNTPTFEQIQPKRMERTDEELAALADDLEAKGYIDAANEVRKNPDAYRYYEAAETRQSYDMRNALEQRGKRLSSRAQKAREDLAWEEETDRWQAVEAEAKASGWQFTDEDYENYQREANQRAVDTSYRQAMSNPYGMPNAEIDFRTGYTLEEASTYEYLKSQGRDAEAEQYAAYMQPIVAQRTNERAAEEIANADPITQTALAIGMSPGKMINAIDIGMQWLDRKITGSNMPIDVHSTGGYRVMADAGREAVTERLNALGSFGDFVNNILGTDFKYDVPILNGLMDMTWGDIYGMGVDLSVATLNRLSFGNFSGAAMMLESSADAFADAQERGATNDELLMYGLISGAAEGIGETLDFGALKAGWSAFGGGKLGWKFTTALGVGAIEYTEGGAQEALTEIITRWADNWVMGENSNFSMRVRSLIAEGYTPQQAADIAQDEADSELLKTFIVGGLSQGVGFLGGGVLGIGRDARDTGRRINALGNRDTLQQMFSEASGTDVQMPKSNAGVGRTVNKQMRQLQQANDAERDAAVLDYYDRMKGTYAEGATEQDIAAARKNSPELKAVREALLRSAQGRKVSGKQQRLLAIDDSAKKTLEAYNKGEIEMSDAAVKRAETMDYAQAATMIPDIKGVRDSIETGGTTEAVKQQASEVGAKMTRVNAAGSSVNGKSIQGIDGIKQTANGSQDAVVTVTMADGTKRDVQVDDVSFGHDVNTEVIEYASIMKTPELANNFIEASRTASVGLDRLANGMNTAFDMGRAGFRNLSTVQRSTLTQRIDGNVIKAAYEMGVAARGKSIEGRIDKAAQRIAKYLGRDWRPGNVKKTGIDMTSLSDIQRKNVEQVEMVAKLMGINVELFESKANSKGKFVGENGSYNSRTNTIRLDINAGRNEAGEHTMAETAMLRTMSHELTHAIQRNTLKQYEALRSAVLDVLEAQGENIENLVDKHLANDKSLKDRDAAIDEIVADACEMMLRDSDAIKQLRDAHPDVAKTFGEKVMEFIDNLLNAIREIFGKENTAESKALAKAMESDLKRIRDMWSDALVETAEVSGREMAVQEDNVGNTEAFNDSYEAIQNQARPPYTDGTKACTEFVEGLNEEARATYDLLYNFYQASRLGKRNLSSKFMYYNDWNDKIASNASWAERARAMAATLPDDVRRKMNLNEDGTLNPTSLEVEFKMNRSMGQRLIDALETEVIDPKYIIDGKEITLSTGNSANAVGGEAYRRAICEEVRKAYRAGTLKQASIGTLSKDRWGSLGFLASNGKTGASGDFTTLCPQMFYNKGCHYCYRLAALKSGVNNKLVGANVWYGGEILRIKDSDIDMLNKNGGLRIQSFGDWMPQFSSQLADMMYDADMRGLQIKIITKEPSMIEYVARLREQGIGKSLYFNLSADYAIERAGDKETADYTTMNTDRPYMRDAQGGLWWKRAMTVQEANKYRKKYDWVNTRIVATTQEEFIRGLKDPTVDVVTGYHGNIREWERIDSETGNAVVNVEALGDAGMPVFAYDAATGEWTTEYEGKTATHKKLAKAIAAEGLQYEYYVKTCCITGRCAKCNGKCGAMAKPFNMKNATNRDAESVAYWQREMEYDDDSITQFSTRVTEDDVAKMNPRQIDEGYFAALNSGADEEQLMRYVTAMARKKGYNSPLLFHGTKEFGHTKFDLGRSEYGISIFATDTWQMAQGYAGGKSVIRRPGVKNRVNSEWLKTATAEDMANELRQLGYGDAIGGTDKDAVSRIAKGAETISRNIDRLMHEFDSLPTKAHELYNPTAVRDIVEQLNMLKSIDFAVLLDNKAGKDFKSLKRKISRIVNDLWDNEATRATAERIENAFGDVDYEYEQLTEMRGTDRITLTRDGKPKKLRLNEAAKIIKNEGIGGVYQMFGKMDGMLEVDGAGAQWNEIPGAVIGKPNEKVRTDDIADYAKQHGYSGVKIDNIIDYDNVVDDAPAGGVYVFFDPSALKSADPVTYDDNGNVIPPSQRFNAAETDIRYSMRDPDAISDREILANALESAVQDDEERTRLAAYKENLDKLNEAQQELDEQKGIIRELMFKKGRTKEETMRLNQARNRAHILSEQVARADRSLLKLEAMAPIQNVLKREGDKVRAKMSALQNERISEVRASHANAATVAKIRTKALALDKILRGANKSTFVPDELRTPLAEVLKMLTYTREGESRKWNVSTERNTVFGDAYGKDGLQRFERLRTAYDAIIKQDGEFAKAADPVIGEMLQKLSYAIDGKDIKALDSEGLDMVNYVLNSFKHMISESNKLHRAVRSFTIEQATARFENETANKAYLHSQFNQSGFVKMIRDGQLTPPYYFRRLGGIFGELGNDLLKGESTYGILYGQYTKRVQNILAKYNHKKWADKKGDTLTVTTKSGAEVTLTREQALSIYATHERQKRDNIHKARHLQGGGISLKVDESTLPLFKGVPLKSESIPLEASDIRQITDWLTDEQISFANEMVKLMSGDLAKLGNQTSRILYGNSKFGEGFYFPYVVDKQFFDVELGATGDALIKNMGFTHSLQDGATKPIIISDFTDVVTQHINSMLIYHSFAIPQDNIMRLLNHHISENETVNKRFKAAYGMHMSEYLRQLMRDIYGGIGTKDPANKIVGGLIGRARKNSVMWSASVAIQQPSSVARAFAYVNPKYFAGKPTRKAYDELLKYSGTANIKAVGGFDTGNTRNFADAMRSERWAEGVVDGWDKAGSWLPGEMDKMTWAAIWEAVKREQAAKTGLAKTDEKLLDIAGERFDEIIRLTQVYDSTLSKSQNMRSDSSMMKAFTAFFGEPTLTSNMVMDAFSSEAGKGMRGRVLASVGFNILLNSLLKSLVGAARDDDDENAKYWERYVKYLTGDFIDNLNPFNYIPLVKDGWSTLLGFTVGRSDLAIADDAVDLINLILKDDKSGWAIAEASVKFLSGISGTGVSNIWRDVEAAFNTYNSRDNSFRDGWFINALKEGSVDTVPFLDKILPTPAEKLYLLAVDGDTAGISKQRKYMHDYRGKDDKQIDSAFRSEVKKAYLDGDISNEKAIELITEYGGQDANKAYMTVEEWKYESAGNGDFTKMVKVTDAIDAGDDKALKDATKELIEHGGYDTPKDAAQNIASGITRTYKPLYVAASPAERKKMKPMLLDAYATVYSTAGVEFDRNKRSDNIDKWLEED